MKPFTTVVITLIVSAAAVAAWVLSGIYDVSARVPHWPITADILEIARERSVEFHSGSAALPDLNDPQRIQSGAAHFHETCRHCHGAPGQERDEFARGLYPSPPAFTKEVLEESSGQELFWIVDNGLKMTGMPAFGGTHSKDEMIGMVAFIEHLPAVSADDYNWMVRQVAGDHHEHDETSDHAMGPPQKAETGQ